MALDFQAVAEGIAAAVRTAAITVNGQALTCTDHFPASIVVPHFAVGDFTNLYHRTFGGFDEVTFTSFALVSKADEPTGQKAARVLASSGSIPAAIEAARGAPGQMALDGAADDLWVQSCRGPRVIEVAGDTYYAVEFTIPVKG